MKLCNINKFLYIFVLLILLTIFIRVLNNKKLVEKFSNIWRLNSSGQLCNNNGECKNIGILNNNNQICNINGDCLSANLSNIGGGGGGAVSGGNHIGGGSGGSGNDDVGGVGGGGSGGGGVSSGVGSEGSSDNTITITSYSILIKNPENEYVLSKTYDINDISNYFTEEYNYYVVNDELLYFDDTDYSLKVSYKNKINYNNPYGSDNTYGSDCNDGDDDNKCPTIDQLYLLGIGGYGEKIETAYNADRGNAFNDFDTLQTPLTGQLLELSKYRINSQNIKKLQYKDGSFKNNDTFLPILLINFNEKISIEDDLILIKFKNPNVKIENLQILLKNPNGQGGIITTVNPTNT